MLTACQLEIVESCQKHSHRRHRARGNISSEVVNTLAAFAIPAYHPKGAVFFVEGQPTPGVFILYSGRVKLFTSSVDGKTFILKFAVPGETLGLAETLSGQPCEVWAEATQLTQSGFVERNTLVALMRRHNELAVHVAIQLGQSYCSVIAGVRATKLSLSTTQKLARFLLDWYESNHPSYDERVAPFTLTHEEIAQVIGSSRETVTRCLSGFKNKGLIQWKGRNLVLTDRAALESSAGN
jgi:CRP/FNR family cyclic AMP-dependent transcriptional regulator